MFEPPYVQFASPPLPYFLECGCSEYRPDDQHPNRRDLGVFDMLFVQSGALYIGEGDRIWTLLAGQMLLLRPDGYHYTTRPCDSDTRFYWLHIQTDSEWTEIDADVAPQHDKGNSNMPFPYTFQFPKYWTLPYPEQLFALLDSLLQSSAEPQSNAFWQQQQLFLQLLKMLDMRQFEQRTSVSVMLAEQTEAYLKSNYQSAITNDLLSKALHFHYNYIARCMKQVYGVTPLEYLARYRLEQAKLLLQRTDWPIAHIAEYVGFPNAAYFTRRFTGHAGLSPRYYRMRYMRDDR